MPHVQGLYPNGWATSHVTVFLGGQQGRSVSVLIEGRGRSKQPFTLQLTVSDSTVGRQVPGQRAFSLKQIVPADSELQIDTQELRNDCDGSACADAYSSSPEERPFSYRLDRGCAYTIRKLTIVDDAGRQSVLFSNRWAFMFAMALPILIIRDTFRINGRLSIREQLKNVWKLCRAVSSSGQVTRRPVSR
jgi:hypothetical protein